MNDFWNNLSRYPRFFISSLLGLILIILTPFRNLLKNRKLRVILLFMLILLILTLFLILKNMIAL